MIFAKDNQQMRWIIKSIWSHPLFVKEGIIVKDKIQNYSYETSFKIILLLAQAKMHGIVSDHKVWLLLYVLATLS